jgi:kynureninase
LIGCFSAASNITGILTDTNKVSACLHRYGALAVWDYATAGIHVVEFPSGIYSQITEIDAIISRMT